jgi:hypothetical protein
VNLRDVAYLAATNSNIFTATQGFPTGFTLGTGITTGDGAFAFPAGPGTLLVSTGSGANLTAVNAISLGGYVAASFLGSGGTAVDSAKLGGTVAAGYLLTAGTGAGLTAVDAITLQGIAASGFATAGDLSGHVANTTSSHGLTAGDLQTQITGKLETAGTAADSSKLGGVVAAGYLKTGGTGTGLTAVNATSLGNVVATGYLQTGGSGSGLTSVNAATLNGSSLSEIVFSDLAWDNAAKILYIGGTTGTAGGGLVLGTGGVLVAGSTGASGVWTPGANGAVTLQSGVIVGYTNGT